MTNSWGPLGNPSKEQINAWLNLPYGDFTKIINNAKKKPPKDFGNYVVTFKKTITTQEVCQYTIENTSKKEAETLARALLFQLNKGQISFDFKVSLKDNVSYSVTTPVKA